MAEDPRIQTVRDIFAAWSSGDTMYAAFEDVRKYWLLSAPIAELGNATK